MSYTPEQRKQLEDLRDAVIAALEGRPVQVLDMRKPGAQWEAYNATFDNPNFLYRPAPPMVKLRYRRCVLGAGPGHLYVDTVNDVSDGVLMDQYRSPSAREESESFVKWLDDDWVEVEVEAPV